jgi:YidC/Oxa1 family membrane protein insertase
VHSDVLDFVYYPVSGILWVWHRVFGFILGFGDYERGASNGFAWALAVIFLVFTLRLILYKPFVKQVRTTRQMQELQPQIKALQKKYGKDRQRLAVEMQKLQKEHGFNPLLGCLPMLAQIPVFIGLYHVLQSFNRTGGLGPGRGIITDEGCVGSGIENCNRYVLNASTHNYFFSADDVQSFLDARLFGAPISSYMTQSNEQLFAFTSEATNGILSGELPQRWHIAAVAIPLMIIAAIATHLNARHSVSRQSAQAAAQPQAAIMNKLVLYVFPFGVLAGGPFLAVAILLYWVSNNAWTLVQQRIVYTRIDAEEEAKRKEAVERRNSNAPKPGAKPVVEKRTGTPSLTKGTEATSPVDGGTVADAPAGSSDKSGQQPAPGSAPRPGARPQGNQPRKGNRRKGR